MLSDNQKHLKKFLQYVGTVPNAQNAIFLLYNEKNAEPQKLFDCYQPFLEYSSQNQDLFCALTEINNKKTVIFGLNRSFLNLKDDNQILTHRHLTLLYLLRKYPQVKFCFCFDKDTVSDSSFRTVKQYFERLAFIINYQKIKKCSKSFMILLYHSSDQTIIDTAKLSLQKSITMQKTFYKENQKFVEDIYQSTVKQNKFISINKKLQSQELKAKKKEFQLMISKLQSVQFAQNQKFTPISDSYLNALKIKSSSWKFFKQSQNLKKSQLNKTQSTTKSKKQNSQIHLLFSIWQELFGKTINYIIKKLKNPQQSFLNFHNQSKFLLDNDCEKFASPTKIDLFGSKQSNKPNSSDIVKIFSKVVSIVVKTIKQLGEIQKDAKIQYCNKTLLNFLQIFYQSKVFNDNKKQKSVYDSFMIYSQLFETFYSIKDVKTAQSSFFEANQLMLQFLCNLKIIKKNLISNLSKIVIYQVQFDLKKVKKGESIALQRLSIPLKKIGQQCLEKQSSKIIQSERILSIIQEFQAVSFEQKLHKLSKAHHKKILLILTSIKNEKDLSEKKDFLIQLGKAVFDYLEQNRIDNAPLDLKTKLIEMLSIDPKQVNFVMRAYQRYFDNILKVNRKNSNNLTELESSFIESFINYLIKVGFVQKARQKAFIISLIDENLSKSLLLKCLLKSNAKRQLQFIKNQLTLQKKQLLNEQLKKTVLLIEIFLKKSSSNVERQHNKIDSVLIDI